MVTPMLTADNMPTSPAATLTPAQATAAYETALAAWRLDMSPANAITANEAHKVMRAAYGWRAWSTHVSKSVNLDQPIDLTPLAMVLLSACTAAPLSQPSIEARAVLQGDYTRADIEDAFDLLRMANLIRTGEVKGELCMALVDRAADTARHEMYMAATRAAHALVDAAEQAVHVARAKRDRDCMAALREYEAGFLFAPSVGDAPTST